MKAKIDVQGMTCSHCENRVNTALLSNEGVEKCKASSKKNEVAVAFDEGKISLEKIKSIIAEEGYNVV